MSPEECVQIVESLRRASVIAQAMLYGTTSTTLRGQVSQLRSYSRANDGRFEALVGEMLCEGDAQSMLGPDLRLVLRQLARMTYSRLDAVIVTGEKSVDSFGHALLLQRA